MKVQGKVYRSYVKLAVGKEALFILFIAFILIVAGAYTFGCNLTEQKMKNEFAIEQYDDYTNCLVVSFGDDVEVYHQDVYITHNQLDYEKALQMKGGD